MASVTLQQLTKVYPGPVVAVDGLDLEVGHGELLALVGPSGCGKTTILRLIAGLEQVSAGEVCFDGQPVTRLSPRRRDVAMVFQDGALYPHLSVYGNLAFGLRLRQRDGGWRRLLGRLMGGRFLGGKLGWPAGQSSVESRVRRVSRVFGLDRLLDRKPEQLSGGQRQRVALGRAWVRRPAALLLDEPVSSLDAMARLEIRREVLRLKQETASAMVYVTHDRLEAMALADRVAVLQAGRLQQVGTVAEVTERPRNRFVAKFFVEHEMALARGRLERLERSIGFVSPQFSVSLPERSAGQCESMTGCEVELGLRPADLQVPHRTETGTQSLGQASVLSVATGSLGQTVHLQWDAPTASDRSAEPPLVARAWSPAEGHAALRAGQQVGVGWKPGPLYLFRAATGESLLWESDSAT